MLQRLALCLSLALCTSYRVPLLRPVQTSRSRTPLAQDEAQTVDLAETATAAIDSLMSALSPEVEPPKALMPLKSAIQGGDQAEIAKSLYLLVVENALDYDVNADKVIVKSEVDYGNLDDPRVREKIGYVYTYGISMFKRGYINEGDLKDAVINHVAGRVGMNGPALDKWLEIPAVN